MHFTFKNKKITGMALILPSIERDFMDDMKLFNAPERRSLKLKETMGYDKHFLAPDDVCSSDIAEFGFNELFKSGDLKADEIDALIFITASPDHFLPPTGRILHGRLGLKKECYCLDITQGCSAFSEGLIQAFLLLDQPSVKKVAIVTADVLSHKGSPKDRNSYPIGGDAAAICIVENSNKPNEIHAIMYNDGTRCDALKIPAGGFRLPSSDETRIMKEDNDGNARCLDNLVMDGMAVFNFVMQDVPPLINELCQISGVSKDKVDYFLFHQPNRFMLNKLAEKLEIPYEKMPANLVEKYGNSSGSTIPAISVLTFENKKMPECQKVCFSGFGVGLSWSAIMMDLYPFVFCKTFRMKG